MATRNYAQTYHVCDGEYLAVVSPGNLEETHLQNLKLLLQWYQTLAEIVKLSIMMSFFARFRIARINFIVSPRQRGCCHQW
ncbi:hypothetical protein V22_19670 [Calycomorphotria hydatis]|uniref:Uncharacterized protein n=1 Tax=Calycomorphotria hydatis TaxID=2528027 RepID=A0A517T8N0_9PLAN|nr:hypothetical protein V22_19670 [Calycomorphotria hydatis]